MENSCSAFQLFGKGGTTPVGYKETTCHMTFDVKMDLTRKACYVAGGNLINLPSSVSYTSVVSQYIS